MALYKDQTLTGEITLDANQFESVRFENARLIYAGGVPPSFNNVTFTDTTVDFRGPANATLNFLRSMAPEATGMREVVLGLLPELRA
jgi:hypothetical protein